jgi:streptogramin lyase
VLVGNDGRAWLLRLAPDDGRQRARVELGKYGEDNGGVTVGAGAVWVAAGAWLVRVDPARDRVVRRIRVGSTAISVFATPSAIWVTRAAGRLGELVRVDPTTNRVVTRTTMGGGSESVVQALGSLWVVNTSPPSLMRVDPSSNDVPRRCWEMRP